MKNKNIAYYSYYFILLAVLGFQVIQTVYSGGIFVHNTHQLKNLNAQNQILVEENQRLATSLSNETSLGNLASSDTLEGYNKITNPIVITDKTMVASR